MDNKILLFMLSLCFLIPASALELRLPPRGSDVVGDIEYTYAQYNETMADVGRRFSIGLLEMKDANPKLSAVQVLRPGTKLVVPAMFILPPGPRKGIVINLAELRLYYYPPGSGTVITEAVGIGREGWSTPEGTTRIVEKKRNPTWYPTKNVRDDARSLGVELPRFVPPGPDNPLGKYSMRLGWREYLIHGTNKPEGVGRRSSAGCIRMFPESVERVFKRASVGTQVRVVNEPFKVGWYRNQLFLEAHLPLQETTDKYNMSMASLVNNVHNKTKHKKAMVRWRDAKSISKEVNGLPTRIGERQ